MILTVQQFNLLKILMEVYPKSIMLSTIKDQMLDKNSDVTRLIERLLKKKLVVRKSDATNRRKLNIKLSDKGHALLKKMETAIRKFEYLLEGLSNGEVKQLNALLDKIRQE